MANAFIVLPDILPTFCCNENKTIFFDEYTCVLFLSNNLGRVLEELNAKIHKDQREISTLPKIVKTPRPEMNVVDVKIQRAKSKKHFKDVTGKNIKEIEMQSKNKEEENIQKINPSNQSKNIGTTYENHISTKPSRGVGKKSVNSIKGTLTIKKKSANATCVKLRTNDANFTSTKNFTYDSLEALKTHPDYRNAQSVLTQHIKAVSSHPVDCHSRHRNIKERDSMCSYSSLTEMKPPSQSAPSEDLERNTFNRKDPKVLKRLTSDFLNVGSASKTHLKVIVKPSDTEETSKYSLEEHKEGIRVNQDRDTLKPVQADATLLKSSHDSSVNAAKPIIPFVAKPTKSTEKALPSNPSNSGQARIKKRTTRQCVLRERSLFDSASLPTGSSQTCKAIKETTHVSQQPLEDLLKDKKLTESSKHQQDCHNPWNTNDAQSYLKMCLLTSPAENQSETSHFERNYKECSQFCSTHQRTTKKSKHNTTSLPGKTQKADTLERLVKQNGTQLFEFKCRTTEGHSVMASTIETKSEALSKSISPQKTRISTNEKNKKRVIETASKAKTPHTLTAVGENCAAKQKFNKNELSSCSLSSTSYHPPLPSVTTNSTISVGIFTTMPPRGHLTHGSGLSSGQHRPR